MSTVDIDSLLDGLFQVKIGDNQKGFLYAKLSPKSKKLIKAHLKAELLAKMPKPKAEIQMTDYLNGVADGYNQAITEITKLVEGM